MFISPIDNLGVKVDRTNKLLEQQAKLSRLQDVITRTSYGSFDYYEKVDIYHHPEMKNSRDLAKSIISATISIPTNRESLWQLCAASFFVRVPAEVPNS